MYEIDLPEFLFAIIWTYCILQEVRKIKRNLDITFSEQVYKGIDHEFER